MLEGTSKPFEEQFNTWYKKFLTEEASMNKEIREAKDYKQKRLEQSRQEAKTTLKNYEAQQREKLEIEKLKEKLKNYKGDKIDINKEMIRLDDISSKLEILGKEAKEFYDFELTYLGKVAKKYDTIKDDTIKSIYVNSSEEVVISRIKYYISYEKYFLICNDIIKQLLSFL